jgi:hypothetical protein
MKICKKCGIEFPTWILIDEKRRNLNNRKYCLTCSPFGSLNKIKIDEIPSDRFCCKCGASLSGNKTKYCSIKCKKTDHTNTKNTYESQQGRAILRKLGLVSMMGGKCQKCGYSKNLAALSFHHNDSSKKKMRLDSRHLSGRSMDKIAEEIKKCSLLCHNCHSEHHYPYLDLDVLLSRVL